MLDEYHEKRYYLWEMKENLTAFIDRLRSGEESFFDQKLSEEDLGASDGDLRFAKGASVKGKAYLAEDHLVIVLDINANPEMPCTICNDWTPVGFSIEKYYITKPLEEIPSNVYPFLEDVREAILLEMPQFAECKGNCPSREALNNYCGRKKEGADSQEAHLPFKDL